MVWICITTHSHAVVCNPYTPTGGCETIDELNQKCLGPMWKVFLTEQFPNIYTFLMDKQRRIPTKMNRDSLTITLAITSSWEELWSGHNTELVTFITRNIRFETINVTLGVLLQIKQKKTWLSDWKLSLEIWLKLILVLTLSMCFEAQYMENIIAFKV